MNTVLAAIILDQQTENEIRAATYAGMTVTTHEALINYAGWTGAGYNLIDPASGAGAYKISGGENGGVLISEATMDILKAVGFIDLSVVFVIVFATVFYYGAILITAYASLIAKLFFYAGFMITGWEAASILKRCDDIKAFQAIVALLFWEAIKVISDINWIVGGVVLFFETIYKPEPC